MKSSNKKYQLVKCLINDLDFISFGFFISIKNIPYIIYIKKGKEYYNPLNQFEEKNIIAFYDIINEQITLNLRIHILIILKISNIFSIKKYKRDLIVSISLSSIKIWNFKNM